MGDDEGIERKIVSRKDATVRGLKKYFTGKPCKKSGHVCERALNGNCVACKKEYDIKYSRENAEAIAAYKGKMPKLSRHTIGNIPKRIRRLSRHTKGNISKRIRRLSRQGTGNIPKRIRVGGTNTRKTAESMMRASAWRRCAETCSKEPSKPPRCPRHPKPTKPLGTMVKTF
jgi:hypothetical protein